MHGEKRGSGSSQDARAARCLSQGERQGASARVTETENKHWDSFVNLDATQCLVKLGVWSTLAAFVDPTYILRLLEVQSVH